MTFRDRTDAGLQLAAALHYLKGRLGLLVLALPRGGVPVAAMVARALGAPLDLCFAHKIGAPHNPEFALGAVAETGPPYLDLQSIASLHIPSPWILDEAARQQSNLARIALQYRRDTPPPTVTARSIILIDDGAATGATALAALHALRVQSPSRLIFATPVAPPDTAQRLSLAADEAVILHTPRSFSAVGEFYDSFPQVSDAEVLSLLHQTPDPMQGLTRNPMLEGMR